LGAEILDVRDRVPVGLGDGVEPLEVAARAPGTVGLRDEVERRCPRAVGAAYDALFLHPVELLFDDGQLVRRQAAGAGEHGGPRGLDGALDRVLRRRLVVALRDSWELAEDGGPLGVGFDAVHEGGFCLVETSEGVEAVSLT
ncbi:Hypothetical predicted protein, partial [Paramuricea clavata]